jgi:hypothetical protein
MTLLKSIISLNHYTQSHMSIQNSKIYFPFLSIGKVIFGIIPLDTFIPIGFKDLVDDSLPLMVETPHDIAFSYTSSFSILIFAPGSYSSPGDSNNNSNAISASPLVFGEILP